MNRDQLKRLKGLETENPRLKRVMADLSLDKMILIKAERGNFRALPVAVGAMILCGRPSVYRSAGSSATLGQHRSSQRKVPRSLSDEERLTDDIIDPTLSALR